jgi:site-specific recombinase XerD
VTYVPVGICDLPSWGSNGRDSKDCLNGAGVLVWLSERGAPFSKRGFQAMLERAGEAAGFDMKIHPHMLRHACGFKLANEGVDTRTIQAYLGRKSIQHTVRYTELAPTRFKSLFRD